MQRTCWSTFGAVRCMMSTKHNAKANTLCNSSLYMTQTNYSNFFCLFDACIYMYTHTPCCARFCAHTCDARTKCIHVHTRLYAHVYICSCTSSPRASSCTYYTRVYILFSHLCLTGYPSPPYQHIIWKAYYVSVRIPQFVYYDKCTQLFSNSVPRIFCAESNYMFAAVKHIFQFCGSFSWTHVHHMHAPSCSSWIATA